VARLAQVPVRRPDLQRLRKAPLMGPFGAGPVSPAFEARALDALRLGWGEAYEITVADGQWRAWRLDRIGGTIEAGSPEALRQALLDDHETRPVRL
jgi:hypothetical protein